MFKWSSRVKKPFLKYAIEVTQWTKENVSRKWMGCSIYIYHTYMLEFNMTAHSFNHIYTAVVVYICMKNNFYNMQYKELNGLKKLHRPNLRKIMRCSILIHHTYMLQLNIAVKLQPYLCYSCCVYKHENNFWNTLSLYCPYIYLGSPDIHYPLNY